MEKVTEAPEQGVIIKETVDGVAVSKPARTTRGSGGKDVAKPRPDPYIWGIYIMLLMVSLQGEHDMRRAFRFARRMSCSP